MKSSVVIGITLSLLLLTLPAVASDYTLGIYGNANEDDTIDMRDLTYVKLIFFGERPETELADAKYDGEINPLDFVQIKLVIVGKEKELTLVDSADRIVTLKKPVERAVLVNPYAPDVTQILRAEDKIVGVAGSIVKDDVYYPELSKLPNVGYKDYEAMLNLNPDLVVAQVLSAEQKSEKLPGIPVVGYTLYNPKYLSEGIIQLGYVFDKKDEAKHYLNDFHDKYTDLITAQTKGLSEEEKPKVYAESGRGTYGTFGAKAGGHQLIEIAGGRNIFADIAEGMVDVDPEAVVERNPDIIIKYIYSSKGAGYNSDDISPLKAAWGEMMNRSELAECSAVKNRMVYV
ncbi:iron complex transport system substrate-binding protein [Methanophagales archaeon]|nr:iron complex transport system substrate-binding protein [Methanophagales archaeon]